MYLWSRAFPDDEVGVSARRYCDLHGSSEGLMVTKKRQHDLRSVDVEFLDRSGAGTRVRGEMPCDGR